MSERATEEDVFFGLFANIQRYQRIAASRGAHFIWGLQAVGRHKIRDNIWMGIKAYEPSERIGAAMRKWLASGHAGVDVVDFTSALFDFAMIDSAHSTQETAYRI